MVLGVYECGKSSENESVRLTNRLSQWQQCYGCRSGGNAAAQFVGEALCLLVNLHLRPHSSSGTVGQSGSDSA